MKTSKQSTWTALFKG